MNDKGKKDLPPNGDSFEPSDSTRRKFLETIAVLSGASLLYSIPAVRALAATSARIPITNKIDVKLPATYAIRNEDIVLNITPSGKRPVPVKFVANGSVKLTAAQEKNVANVEVISLSLVASNTPDLGDKTEKINAHLAPGTRVGRLNLATGELQAEGNLPVDVTLIPSVAIGRGAPVTGRAMTRYSSAKIAETPPLANAREASSSKCVNNGDVSTKLAIQGRPPAAVSGALKLRMTPQA